MFSVITEGQFTELLESSVKLTVFGAANNTTEASLNNSLGLFTMFLLAVKCTSSAQAQEIISYLIFALILSLVDSSTNTHSEKQKIHANKRLTVIFMHYMLTVFT